MRTLRASLFCLVASCGLFPDLSALSGDASADASASDGAVGEASADVAKSCAHTFCDDFDDSGPLGSTWDDSNTTGGPLALTDAAVSAPNALLATGIVDNNRSSLIKHVVPTHSIHYEFDAKVGAPADVTSTELDFGAIVPTNQPNVASVNLNVQIYSGSGQLECYQRLPDGGINDVTKPVPFDFSTFRHVALDLDFDAETFKVAVDGSPTAQIAMSPPLVAAPTDIWSGVAYVGNNHGTWTVTVDNVIVDVQ